MKYKKILTWACTAALFLTGCTTDTANNGRWMEDSNAVRIQASAGSTLTRSNPIETDESKLTGFNQGDMISVRNRNITVNYTLNGGIWQPEDNDKYLVWDEKDLKFEGYYPYDGKNTFSVGYIKKDQSTLKALAQSDYMNITSTLKSIPSDKLLPLELKRQTARLILRIQQFNDEFSEGVKVNKLEIACPENTNGSGSLELIRPYQQNGNGGEGGVGTTYTALVIPGKRKVVITLNNPGKPTGECELETGALEAGKSYTYNLIVGKNKVTVGGVTVAEWKTGTPLPGGVAEEEDFTPYVTMTANSKQTFKMTCAGTYTLPNLEYSVNNGTWQKVVADQGVEFGGTLGSLLLRGKCPNGTATNYQNYATITFGDENVKVDCSGDIRTLIDYTAYDAVATGNCSFISLFKGCSVLTSAPKLPATALKNSCYRQMFEGCTALTQAPVLPATELKTLCYYSMFSGCTSLTQAPKLPATKLAHSCYKNMFKGCASLVNAPDLPATTLEPSCYSSMFIDCIKLTGAPELKAKIMQNASYHSMFKGCTSLVNAPALQATILDANCYIKMFSGCTSLKTAPLLGAKKLTDWCYQLMFENCTNLESVTMLANEYGYNALAGWLDGAGTNAEGTRILNVSSKDFYDSKIAINNPAEWQIGQCNVWESNGNEILE